MSSWPSSASLTILASLGVAGVALSYAFRQQELLQKERRNRADERRGRINAEKKLIASSLSKGDDSAFSFWSIGRVQSVYSKRFGTPRQPGLVTAPTAVIRIRPELQACLTGLEEFSHVWVLYIFHKNTNLGKVGKSDSSPFAGLKSLIGIPRVPGQKVGIFACRSPHRPNPIGLSLARVVSVDKETGCLVLAGLDAVVGSPVLDIKPYLPAVEDLGSVKVPQWVNASEQAESFLVQWRAARGLPGRMTSSWRWLSEENWCKVVEETLSVGDLRSDHQKQSNTNWLGELVVAQWRVLYSMNKGVIEILEVLPDKHADDDITVPDGQNLVESDTERS